MTTVTTALGQVAADALGTTLMHEHIYSLDLDHRGEYGWDEDAALERAVEVLSDLRSAGIDAIVDLTVMRMGRNVARAAEISRRTGLSIVVATGIYTFAELPPLFRGRTLHVSEHAISDFFVREITEGVADTGIRPGVIKFASDRAGMNDDVTLIAQQAARAQLATGVPISTHSHAASEQGLVQQRAFVEMGVDPGDLVIGHSGDSADLGYLERLIEGGSWLGMDRFGHEPTAPLEQRIDVVAQLCARGYADRMVLSHDTSIHTDSLPAEAKATETFANWHYRCIPDIVVPALLARGVADQDIRTMLVDNPVRILAHD